MVTHDYSSRQASRAGRSKTFRSIILVGAGLFLAAIVVVSLSVIEESKSREALYITAQRDLQDGRAREAFLVFGRLAQSEYKDSKTLASKALYAICADRIREGAYSEAIPELEKLEREKFPGSTDLLTQARYNAEISQGDEALAQKDFNRAIQHYFAAHRETPADEAAEKELRARELRRQAAIVKFKEGTRLKAGRKNSEALAAFREASRIDPSYQPARNEIAKLERTVGALDLLDGLSAATEQALLSEGYEVTVRPGVLDGQGHIGIVIDCTKEPRPKTSCYRLYQTFPSGLDREILVGAGVGTLVYRYEDGWISKGEFRKSLR